MTEIETYTDVEMKYMGRVILTMIIAVALVLILFVAVAFSTEVTITEYFGEHGASMIIQPEWENYTQPPAPPTPLDVIAVSDIEKLIEEKWWLFLFPALAMIYLGLVYPRYKRKKMIVTKRVERGDKYETEGEDTVGKTETAERRRIPGRKFYRRSHKRHE